MDKDTRDIVVTKNLKILHKVFTKMRTLIKSTYGELSHENSHAVLVIIMREMRKYSIHGFEKREIAIEVMCLLLEELGVPGIIAHYTVEVLARQIEIAYTMGFHRYKRRHKKCFFL